MAVVKPFRGIRPPKDLVEQVESRPYDVLDSEEARAEAGDNEKSLYHIIKPEIDFEPGTAENDPKVYDRAVLNFKKFQDNGWLVQDKKDCYYIYAQTMDGRTQYGFVVGASVDDYLNGRIKKHELTRREKEVDRTEHGVDARAGVATLFKVCAEPDERRPVGDAVRGVIHKQPQVVDVLANGRGGVLPLREERGKCVDGCFGDDEHDKVSFFVGWKILSCTVDRLIMR